MSDEDVTPSKWAQLFGASDVSEALTISEDRPFVSMWASLRSVAESRDGDEQLLLQSLAEVASYRLRPDDWNTPYPPAIQEPNGRRTPVPADLSTESLDLLSEAAPWIPQTGLKARVFDVLSIRLAGRLRVENARRGIDALLLEPITAATWYRDREAWDRALSVARRLGKPTRSRMKRLEVPLRAIIRARSEGYEAFQAAEMLAKHRLAEDRSLVIARRLFQLAGTDESDRRRAYLRAASEWCRKAGDRDRSTQLMVDVVHSYVAEAEALAALESNPFRSAHLYEQALEAVRLVPKATRVQLGIGQLPQTIARRIRELGAQGLGTMVGFESETIDLSNAASEASERIRGKSVEEALLAFAGLSDWFAIDEQIRRTEQIIAENPFHTLLAHRQFAGDGRTTYRSSAKGPNLVYNIDEVVWRDLVRLYEWRIDLMVKGALWPAYVELSREHHLSMAEFAVVVANSGIVPSDRVHQVARALYYGFNGDFASALQLLAPQIENLVRFHMLNAGLNTTTIENGIEKEIGLSGLMERAEVEIIFGRDFAFEIRLLFCAPTGPNLRNEVAHGLLSDAAASSSRSVYAWWLGLRLIFVAFWNSLHDVDAAEAREPGQPSERSTSESNEDRHSA